MGERPTGMAGRKVITHRAGWSCCCFSFLNLMNYKPKSTAHKQQQAIGQGISHRLEKLLGSRLTQREVGAKLGISYECARQTEYRALYKLKMRLEGKI